MRCFALSLCVAAEGMKLTALRDHRISPEEAARDVMEERNEAIGARDWAIAMAKNTPAPAKKQPRSPPTPAPPMAPQNWSDFADDGVFDGDLPVGAHAVAWFHPPRTSMSFGPLLYRYANASFPPETDSYLKANWGAFFARYRTDKWFQDGFWHHPCDHAAVTDAVYNRFKGHFIGLFREPRSRVFSAWTQMNEKRPISNCATRMNGTVAMQLAGQAPGEMFMMKEGHKFCHGRFLAQPTAKPEPNVALAVERLREGFKFVGLVEEYDLSVCLFHAKFGGDCFEAEFEKSRPGHYYKDTAYENRMKELAELDDDVDQVLYNIAKERFWADVRAYGVNRSSCKARCPGGNFDSAQESYSN